VHVTFWKRDKQFVFGSMAYWIFVLAIAVLIAIAMSGDLAWREQLSQPSVY